MGVKTLQYLMQNPDFTGIFFACCHNASLFLRAPKADDKSFQPADQTPRVLETVAR